MEMSERMLNTAYNMTVKYGDTIALIKPSEGASYEAGTHRPYWMVSGVKTYTEPAGDSYPGYATIHKPKSYELLDGRIRSTDIVFKCVQIPKPSTDDIIVWKDNKFSIIHVTSSIVKDTAILYTVFTRIQ